MKLFINELPSSASLRRGRLDQSNGYEQAAEQFIACRNPRIGVAIVREWSRTLKPEGSVLDLGCGHGVPVAETLASAGLQVFGIDASAKMIAAFRQRFPGAQAQCAPVEESDFFDRTFDGVVAWGLLFLLPAQRQEELIAKVAKTLRHRGKFLFTSPWQAVTWNDSLTGRPCLSLGAGAYTQLLDRNGLILIDERSDEGQNHHYLVAKL